MTSLIFQISTASWLARNRSSHLQRLVQRRWYLNLNSMSQWLSALLQNRNSSVLNQRALTKSHPRHLMEARGAWVAQESQSLWVNKTAQSLLYSLPNRGSKVAMMLRSLLWLLLCCLETTDQTKINLFSHWLHLSSLLVTKSTLSRATLSMSSLFWRQRHPEPNLLRSSILRYSRDSSASQASSLMVAL